MASHTDLKVGQYYGEMGVDFWDGATWQEELNKNEVCLTYSFNIRTVYVLLGIIISYLHWLIVIFHVG